MTKTCCDCKVVFPAWGTSSHCTSLNSGVSSPDSSGSLQLQGHQMMSTQNENHAVTTATVLPSFCWIFQIALLQIWLSGSLTFVKNRPSLPIFRHLYRMKHLWDRILTRRWMGRRQNHLSLLQAYEHLLRFSDNHSRFVFNRWVTDQFQLQYLGIVISFP